MNPPRPFIAAVAVALAAVGCGADNPPDAASPAGAVLRPPAEPSSIFDPPATRPVARPIAVPRPVETFDERPLPSSAEVRPAVEGALPLAYLVQSRADLRIVDAATGEVLAETAAEAGTAVSVSRRAGVIVGGRTLFPGPLAADHRYAVYVDSGVGPGVFRTGTIRPDAPQPTSGDRPDPPPLIKEPPPAAPAGR